VLTESDRSKESGEVSFTAACLRLSRNSSRRAAGVRVQTIQLLKINVQVESSLLVPPAGPATGHDDGGYKRPRRGWPNFRYTDVTRYVTLTQDSTQVQVIEADDFTKINRDYRLSQSS